MVKRSPFTLLDVLTLSVTLLIAVIYLPYPFFGDQAVFSTGAARLNSGGVLYRDYWDVKQPGIFFFYWLAGKLFGFTEVGIHMLELFYFLALSVVLILALRNHYQHRWIASVTPLLTVAYYYAASDAWHRTQAEVLASLPLFLSCFLAIEALNNRPRAMLAFGAGCAAGGVIVLKAAYLPLPVAFWVVSAGYYLRVKRLPGRTISRLTLWWALGLSVPALFVFAYFAWNGAAHLLYDNVVLYPKGVLAEIPRSPFGARLLNGALWFTETFRPTLVLASLGASLALTRRRTLLAVSMLVWCFVGAAMLLVQVHSGWQYHFLIFLIPAGLLAAEALDAIPTALPAALTVGSRWLEGAAVALALFIMFGNVEKKLVNYCAQLASHRFAIAPEDRMRFYADLSPDYRTIEPQAALLRRPDSYPGDIYVFGNPLYQCLSGRLQAGNYNGWTVSLLLKAQRLQLLRDLERLQPPYIIISNDPWELPVLRERSPDILSFVAERYDVLATYDNATWYRIRK